MLSELVIDGAGNHAEPSSSIHLKAQIILGFLILTYWQRQGVVLKEGVHLLPLNNFINRIIYLSNLTSAQDTLYRH